METANHYVYPQHHRVTVYDEEYANGGTKWKCMDI